jgi:L-asparagine transporter-like permease
MKPKKMLMLFKVIRIVVLIFLLLMYFQTENKAYFYFSIPFIIGLLISFILKGRRRSDLNRG